MDDMRLYYICPNVGKRFSHLLKNETLLAKVGAARYNTAGIV
jgi:hypothetical protein